MLPSTSVRRNVTVPLGRSAMPRAPRKPAHAHAAWSPYLVVTTVPTCTVYGQRRGSGPGWVHDPRAFLGDVQGAADGRCREGDRCVVRDVLQGLAGRRQRRAGPGQ